ncbi:MULTISPECIES: TSUP family transporter [Streptomyces]|uniref:Probable membrane transporter protein n=1 Tax=Streptomyces viridochromogenes TaxID=1938 RepID=A0A0L8JDR4_STRVR|nr:MULTISPECIES: TSUP family transporter [Streptomyces]KOG11817.1 membrane protein [Streptomyces viridochromogenes]
MDLLVLTAIGLLTGATTVLFGFGGGFVAVPVVVWADTALGTDAIRVATATSALVMVVSAAFATAVTPRRVLLALRGTGPLLALLAAGACLGACATRLAPPALARWAFVAYVAATALDLLLRPGFLRPSPPAEPARGATATRPEPVPGATATRPEPGRPAGTATRAERAQGSARRPLPATAGLPIGAVAAFLGVGGSVMTVPALRRAGHPMGLATALANPLTLAIALPAVLVSLAGSPPLAATTAHSDLVGLVDPYAAAALLLGALPVIALLRRRPPRIPDRAHAWSYIALLAVVALAMLLPELTPDTGVTG